MGSLIEHLSSWSHNQTSTIDLLDFLAQTKMICPTHILYTHLKMLLFTDCIMQTHSGLTKYSVLEGDSWERAYMTKSDEHWES